MIYNKTLWSFPSFLFSGHFSCVSIRGELFETWECSITNIRSRIVGGPWRHKITIYGNGLSVYIHIWQICDVTNHQLFTCEYYTPCDGTRVAYHIYLLKHSLRIVIQTPLLINLSFYLMEIKTPWKMFWAPMQIFKLFISSNSLHLAADKNVYMYIVRFMLSTKVQHIILKWTFLYISLQHEKLNYYFWTTD